MNGPLSEIARALDEGDRDRVVALTGGAIAAHTPAATLLNGAWLPAMNVAGIRFRDYEIVLPDVRATVFPAEIGADAYAPERPPRSNGFGR